MTMYISKEGIIRGEVHSAQGVYTIRSSKGNKNQVIIREVDLSQIPRGDDIGTIDPELLKNFSGENLKKNFQLRESLQESQTLPENQTVDLLVLYTTKAKDSEGGTAEISAAIMSEINKTNKALRDSGLSNRQINLAGMREIDYTQHSSSSAGMKIDLKWLVYEREDQYSDGTKPDPEGIMDEAHKWREQYGADLVHLFVRDVSNLCGVANIYNLYLEEYNTQWCANNDPNNSECLSDERDADWMNLTSFSVSAIDKRCSVQYTFAHELGHNMGIYHDRYEVDTDIDGNTGDLYYGPDINQIRFPYKPYAFGYVNQNFNRPVCWHTIMAYSSQCRNQGFSDYGRTLYFSNPNIRLGRDEVGYDPAGVSGSQQTTSLTGPADASRAIDEIWDDILIHLKPSSQSCKNAVFTNVVPDTLDLDNISLPAGGGVESFRLSDIPDYCAENNLTVERIDSFISVSTEKITNSDDSIDFQVDITADRNNNCASRTGSLTLTGSAGAEKTISIVQESSAPLVRSLICSASSGPLDQIESLDLSGENISELRQSFFDGLTRVEDLDLSSNSISALLNNVFSTLTSLRELDLSRNQISSVSQNTFSQLSELKYLWLNSNNITTLSSSVFSSLSNLRALALDDNQLAELPSGIFSNLSKLRYLWLNANNLSTLPEDIFSGLSRLRYLNLSYNNLDAPLPVGVCTFLRNLRYLVIQGSSLDTLCPTDGGGVRSLFQKFSLNNFIKPSVQGFENLSGAEPHTKIILKMYEDKISLSDISQITGVSEHEITRIIVQRI